MYGLVKTHKVNNPVRVTTSGCGTAVENLSIFVERCLYPEVLKIESRIQDTSEMFNFVDYLNKSNILTEDCILVSFDTVNMIPSIDNHSGLQAVKNALEARQEQFLIISILFRHMVLPKVDICLAHIAILPLKVLIKKHHSINPQL